MPRKKYRRNRLGTILSGIDISKARFSNFGVTCGGGQPWSTAKLVVLNEKEKLAPDREKLSFGSDNNYSTTLWLVKWPDGLRAGQQRLCRVRPERIRVNLDESLCFRSQCSDRARSEIGRLQVRKARVGSWPPPTPATNSLRSSFAFLKWSEMFPSARSLFIGRRWPPFVLKKRSSWQKCSAD